MSPCLDAVCVHFQGTHLESFLKAGLSRLIRCSPSLSKLSIRQSMRITMLQLESEPDPWSCHVSRSQPNPRIFYQRAAYHAQPVVKKRLKALHPAGIDFIHAESAAYWDALVDFEYLEDFSFICGHFHNALFSGQAFPRLKHLHLDLVHLDLMEADDRRESLSDLLFFLSSGPYLQITWTLWVRTSAAASIDYRGRIIVTRCIHALPSTYSQTSLFA